MKQKSGAIDSNARIAIIGAGPAGLSTAWFLLKNGFRNVTVLEKLGRVGGLCKSITIDGMSYDIGANYVTWAYRETLKIAKEVGATTYEEKPYTTIYVHSNGEERAEYRSLKEAILFNPYTKKKVSLWSFIIAAIRYLWIRHGLNSVINPPDAFSKINQRPDLCMPFREWLESNGLSDLASLFEIPTTIMGYGHLTELATPYALRYMPIKTFLPMVLPIKILFPWPRRFTFGFQRLWEKVSWRTNLRLNAMIHQIERQPEGKIVIHFKYIEQELDTIKIVEEIPPMEFDYMVLACPLTPDVFKQLGLERNDWEQKMSEKIRVNPYCMTTFWVNNMEMPKPIAPTLPIHKLGSPWAVARQFQDLGNYFTQFYTRPEPDQSDEQVIEKVRELVSLLGGEIDETQSRWHGFDRFTYFQHVTSKDFADGFYSDLSENQGRDRTFYVGGVTDFELVEPIVEHSKYLVEKHFVGSS